MGLVFANANARMRDIDLFFQGFPLNHPFMVDLRCRHMAAQDIVWHSFQPHETMAHLMHRAGLFASISDARRNGWARTIPNGFTQFTVGKRKISVSVLNLVDEN